MVSVLKILISVDFPDACFSHTLHQSGLNCCAYLNHSLEKPGIGWLTVAVKSFCQQAVSIPVVCVELLLAHISHIFSSDSYGEKERLQLHLEGSTVS